MTGNVIRIADYERRSRNPDAATPRYPADADVIILPMIRTFAPPARVLPPILVSDLVPVDAAALSALLLPDVS